MLSTAVPLMLHDTASGAAVEPVRLTVNAPVVTPASVAVGSFATIVTVGIAGSGAHCSSVYAELPAAL